MPELDTLRGVAVLLVFFYHGIGYWAGGAGSEVTGALRLLVDATLWGWVGVNLFFVLSGFLITGILVDSRERPGYFKTFYYRRALRILPPYYLLLLVLPLLASLTRIPLHVGWKFAGLAFIYCANLSQYFGVALQYGPLWSLAVEEHFYLVWPLLVRRVSNRALLIVSTLVIVASPALRIYAGGDVGVTWKNLDGLAMGAILAVVCREDGRNRVRAVALSSFLLAVLGGIAGIPTKIYLYRTTIGAGFRTSIIDLFFVGVLLSVLLIGTGPLARWVNIRWLQFYGFISYGLYLIHVLVFAIYDGIHGPTSLTVSPVLMRVAITLTAATVISYISRVSFEARFLALKDRLQGSASPEEPQLEEKALPQTAG